MAAPSLDAGDIDGDGRLELLIAGYYATVEAADTNYKRTADDNNYLYAAYLGANTAGSMESPTYMTVPITDSIKRRADMGDRALAPIEVACVAVNGPGALEYALIGHSLCSLSGTSATRHATIGNVETTVSDQTFSLQSSLFSRDMVSSVAVGNFDGNTKGYEQVMMTVGIKLGNDNNNYMHLLYAMGGNAYDSNGNATSYFANVRPQGGLENRNDSTANCLCFIATAADWDEDGVKVRFGGNDYFYSDPNPVAVLQAAPYFGELGTWDDFQGSTSYGYSQSYTFGSSTSQSSSFSAGVIAEIDAEVVEVSAEIGYTMDWNQTFEQAQSTEYSTTFTAGAYDLVILTRTPVFTYYYDVYDSETNAWIDNALGISVPQTPLVYRLSIDEYNDYVVAYNNRLTEYETEYNANHNPDVHATRLVAIDDTNLHKEGNPFSYADDSRADVTPLSEVITVGGAAGSSTFEWVTGAESTINTEKSQGLHFGMSVVGGAIIKGGVYTELDYSKGTGSFKSSGNSTATSGTVIDLNVAGGQAATGNYGFNWQFCTWNVNLGINSSVLVYGYMLSNIQAPAPAVSDLTVENYNAAANEYTLKWTAPDTSSRTAIVGYNVYVKNGDAYTKKNTDALITATEYTFSHSGNYSDAFIVRSVDSAGTESADSNEAMYFKGTDGKSAYEIALDNGFDGTQEEWLQSLEGSSAYEVAVERGYTGSVTEWLNSLRGDNGVDGESAFDLAAANGYEGSLNEWLNSLIGATGEKGEKGDTGDAGKSAYEIALESGFIGTEEEWVASLRGSSGRGSAGTDGKDGVGISNVKIDSDGYLIVTLTNGTLINAGSVRRAQFDPDDVLDLYSDSPFTDVLKTFWYADAVDFCYSYGLIGGTDAKTFSPNLPVSRGMMVTVLYRLEGSPTVYGNSFDDVVTGQYYVSPVTWAAINDIVSGYGNGRFAPNDTVSYEQAMTIFYRYAQYRKYDTRISGDLTEYSDAGKAGAYALEALNWGEGNDMIVGKSGNILAPNAELKRCELASLFYRFCLYAVD